MSTLLIRADAGERIGTGHVMRCVALAQAWQAAGGEVTFALTSGAETLLPRLRSEGVEIAMLAVEPGSNEDARAVAELARGKNAAWVVVDGYCFAADYQKLIKDAGLSLLFVDDNVHVDHYSADLVLNQNLHAREEMYVCREPYTKLLLGPHYALLRRECLFRRQSKREFLQVATKLLVTMGGCDPANRTVEVLRSIEHLGLHDLEVRVVAGPGYSHWPGLLAQAKRSGGKVEILANAYMPEWMAWAHMAVAAAGSTVWELCLFGVPSLLLPISENQRRTAEELALRGAAFDLGWPGDGRGECLGRAIEELANDPSLRAEMSKRARLIVDGNGAARVAKNLRGVALELRRVREKDCKLLWEWANDPQARAASFSPGAISWEEHVAWLAQKMADTGCFMFVGTSHSGVPIGQVRFDLLGESEALVHVSVAPGHRGCGFGRALIVQGVSEVCSLTRTRSIHAYIKPENDASIRAFEQAEFHRAGMAQFRGHQALHYIHEARESLALACSPEN